MRHGGFSVGSAIIIIIIIIINNCSSINIINMIINIHLTIRQRLGCGFERGFGGEMGEG